MLKTFQHSFHPRCPFSRWGVIISFPSSLNCNLSVILFYFIQNGDYRYSCSGIIIYTICLRNFLIEFISPVFAGVFMTTRLFFRMLEKRSLSYNDGPIPVPLDEPFLADNVQRICVCDTGIYVIHLFIFNCLDGNLLIWLLSFLIEWVARYETSLIWF